MRLKPAKHWVHTWLLYVWLLGRCMTDLTDSSSAMLFMSNVNISLVTQRPLVTNDVTVSVMSLSIFLGPEGVLSQFMYSPNTYCTFTMMGLQVNDPFYKWRVSCPDLKFKFGIWGIRKEDQFWEQCPSSGVLLVDNQSSLKKREWNNNME